MKSTRTERMALEKELLIVQAKRRRAATHAEWGICCVEETRIKAALLELKEAGLRS